MATVRKIFCSRDKKITCQQFIVFTLTFLSWAHTILALAEEPSHGPSLTVDSIREQLGLNSNQLSQFHWTADGSMVGYMQVNHTALQSPSKTGTVSSIELWRLDTTSGKTSLLLSSAQIGAALIEDQAKQTTNAGHPVPHDLLKDYAWAPGNHAVLLIGSRSLAWFDLEAGKSKVLVTGNDELRDVKLSPDGRKVSFLCHHSLSITDIAVAKTIEITHSDDNLLRAETDWIYSHSLGLKTAYWWSPDAAQIAFLELDEHSVATHTIEKVNGDDKVIFYPKPSGVIPQAHIYVQSLSGGKAHEITVSPKDAGYLPRVTWLPDAKHIAIEYLSRDQQLLRLYIADAASNQTKLVLSEKDDYWINLTDDPLFLKDSKRFLWLSERTGYRHLYLYGTDGHLLAPLTKGNWEVSSLAGVDESAGQVYFTATEQSPLERQIYRVGLEGTNMTRITQEKGWHEAGLLPGSHGLWDTYSNRANPPRWNLLRVDGNKLSTLPENPPAAPPKFSPQPAEFLTVKTHMGVGLDAFIMKPPDFDPARQYPVLVYVQGGPGEQAVRDAWDGDFALWFQIMVRQGYIIFALNNRGSAGYGHLFEEPLHLRLAAQEMSDQRDGVRYLRSLPYVDKNRIGICGWGYGGFLATHAMLDLPIIYKAGFAGAPVTDWLQYDTAFAERYLGDTVHNDNGYDASSPLDNVANLKTPFLIAQGTADETVHLKQTLTLLDGLIAAGNSPDLLLLPDQGHEIEDPHARSLLFKRLTEFFLKNL